MSYNPTGALVSVTPPGRSAHAFEYDDRERMTVYAAPEVSGIDSGVTVSYNMEGQVTLITRADGRTVTMSYDGAGRRESIGLSRGLYQVEYSATTGQVSQEVAPDSSTLAYSYLGDRLQTTTWSGTASGTVGVSYDADGRVAGTQVGAGSGMSYAYDDDGLLTSVQSNGCFLSAGCVCAGQGSPPACSGQTQAPVLQLERDAASGLLTSTVLGGSTTNWAHNGFGELVAQQSTQGAAALFSESFTRDKLGRITHEVETIEGVTVERDYAYDTRGRLQQVQENGVLVSGYAYDLNGNRVSRTTPSGTTSGVYDGQDRLVSYGTFTYEYTADGELLSKTETPTGAVTRYVYDELGNLLEVELPDSRVVEYEIDAQDRRVGRKVDGVVTNRWLYRDQLEPIAEQNANGELVSLFVYGTRSHVPDVMIRDGVSYRIVADQVGSVRLVVDVATGMVAQRLDYDEFGKVVSDTAPGFQPFGFAGGLYDADTGLVRFGARDYDPVTGRWTAKDPSLFRGGLNLYGYAKNDPVNFIDPVGRWPFQSEWQFRDAWNQLFHPGKPRWPGMFPGEGPDWHHNRNRNQAGKCPPRQPDSNMCGGEGSNWSNWGTGNPFHGNQTDMRGRGDLAGVQCIYDSNGNLDESFYFGGSWDYGPPDDNMTKHITDDVLPWVIWGP